MSKSVAVVLCAVTATLWLGASAWAAPTADELCKMMVAKEVAFKTAEMDSVTVDKVTLNNVNRETTTTAHTAVARSTENGKTVVKFCVTQKATMKIGEQTGATEMKLVSDGKVFWAEQKILTPPQVRAIKMTPEQAAPFGLGEGPIMSQRALDGMKKVFNLEAVGEDKIDGRDMFVLTGKLKAELPNAEQLQSLVATVKVYVDKENMQVRRQVVYDMLENETKRVEVSNVKVDGKVDATMFEYTPPAGMDVIDQTKTPVPAPTDQPK